MSVWIVPLAVFLSLLAWLPEGGAAELDTATLPFVTQHRGVFGGQSVDYTASVVATDIAGAAGEPAIRFVSTAYVRKGVDAASRPVLFVFNGGPSTSSATLHMMALGPRRIVVEQDPTRSMPDPLQVVDNVETVLDVADLVFFDPVETGFSRVRGAVNAATLYSTDGDSHAAAQFVATWSRANDRAASPRFLLGESYGTIRAALMAGELSETTPLAGVFLFGQAVNIVETSQRARNAVGYATNLPALAAVAAYHGKAKLGGKSLAGFIDASYDWAMHDYLPALLRGQDLPREARSRIAQRLEQFIGIAASYYLEHDLAITKVEFARLLLADRQSIVAAYDARYVAALPSGGGRAVDPFAKVRAPILPALRGYLSGTLAVTLPMDEYRDVAPANAWTYTPTGGAGGPFWDYDYQAALGKAFAANPRFELVIGTGVYDLTTTIGPARYLIAQSRYPRDRIVLRQYDGGHMAYTNEPARKAFTDDVRAWLTGAAFPATSLSPAQNRTRRSP